MFPDPRLNGLFNTKKGGIWHVTFFNAVRAPITYNVSVECMQGVALPGGACSITSRTLNERGVGPHGTAQYFCRGRFANIAFVVTCTWEVHGRYMYLANDLAVLRPRAINYQLVRNYPCIRNVRVPGSCTLPRPRK